jgi:SAM-dependent methyltransferase
MLRKKIGSMLGDVERRICGRMPEQKLEQYFADKVPSFASDGLSLTYAIKIFEEICFIGRQANVNFKDATVAEIGPGPHLGVLLLFLYIGAKKGYGIDVHKAELDSHELYASLLKYFRCLHGGYWYRPWADDTGILEIYEFDKDRVANRPDPLELRRRIDYIAPHVESKLPINSDEVDYLYSMSALEHVHKAKIKGLLEEIYRVLKPGGVTYHEIDLRDHNYVSGPLGHLQYGDAEWEKMTMSYGDRLGVFDIFQGKDVRVYTNRIRYQEFLDLFSGVGFNIEAHYPLMKVKRKIVERSVLHPEFRLLDEDELSKAVMAVVARK